MSEVINATEYNDPLVNVIKAEVATKSDDTPYLLLPVKVETRFMKVDRSIEEDDKFPEVLEGLFELEDQLSFKPSVLPTHEVLGKVKKLQSQSDDLSEKTSQIHRLSGKDKEFLQSRIVHLESTHKKLSRSLSKIKWPDEEATQALKRLKSSMAHAMLQACSKVNQLEATNETPFKDSASFLDTLQGVNVALLDLGSKNLTTRNRKEKRVLFGYIDSKLLKINQAVVSANAAIHINMLATTSQIKQLDALKIKAEQQLRVAEKNINKIYSDYKKAEYKEKLAVISRKVNGLYDEIDRRVKPKMEMKRNLKMISAREVIYQVNALRLQLKQLNILPFKTYDEIDNTKQNLYKRIKTLQASVYRVIEGTEKERDAIRRAWDNVDIGLGKFNIRLVAFKGQEPQESAVKRMISHINKEFRHGLAGLKSSSKSHFTILNNSNLEKSALVFNRSLNTLQSIEQEINAHMSKPKSKKLREALNKLINFQESFSVASREIHILPQKSYNELKKVSTKIGSSIKKLNASAEPTPRARTSNISVKASTAMESINTAIDAQHTDAINRKERFTNANRGPIVFADKTITQDELWVRIYPDDIAIHTHEEALTLEEVEAGKAYWYEVWAADDDYEAKLAAWRAISTSYGSQRAAWIVKTMEAKETEVEKLRSRFQLRSKPTVDANDKLKQVCDMLIRGGDVNEIIKVFGQAYPILDLVEKGLKKIDESHVTLLKKTQHLLLKVQSQVNQLALRVRNEADPEIHARSGALNVVQQFVSAFDRSAKSFQSIKRVDSRELLGKEKEEAGLFPEPEIKESGWTVAPHSKVMPDRFVVITKRNGQYLHVVAGESLPPDQLVVGLDPETFDSETFQYDDDGNLIVDESIKWLTDFEEAKTKGMAVSFTLNAEDVTKGFDKLFVLGVKDTTELEGKELLEQLIDNHHYLPEGSSFLPVATPTNNTEAGASGYRTFEEDAALSFAIERNNEEAPAVSADPGFPTDGARLAEGLGVDSDIFDNLDYHDRTEVSEALLLNKALFHGTLGNYMEEGLDTLFTLDNINHTKEFLCNYVSARGFLPTLRIGTQPYGILPTTAFSEFHVTSNDGFLPQFEKEDFENTAAIEAELKTRYDIRLKQFLEHLDGLWTDIRTQNVPHLGNTNPDDPQAHFMQMLGLQASSAEHFYRYGLNIAARQATEEGDFSINFDPDDAWSPTNVNLIFQDIVATGYYYKSDHFSDEYEDLPDPEASKSNRISNQFNKARVFATRHLDAQAQILGDIIDSRELSEELVTATDPKDLTGEEKHKAQAELNYFIDWMVDNNPWDVHAENKFSVVSEDEALTVGMPSKSFLFLLLRHSLLSAHVDTILKILEFEGLTDQLTRKKMGQPDHFYSRLSGAFNYLTKWTYLFSKIDRLQGALGFNMDEANPFFIYMNSLAGSNDGYLNRYLSLQHEHVFNNYSNHGQHQPFVDELEITRSAILKLKDIPTARLERMLVEHIDLCTYRLDAWRLGMVNKRLKSQRTQSASGIYLGAYGWVEDLRKGGDRDQAKNIPEGLWKNGDDPVYTDEDNLGFIHTPSLNHAITAAILRAGYKANVATAEVENQMAVNLSSARVRMALSLLNGIRNGQDAAAMLGYQFERGLHENYLHVPLELDQYIYDFRDEFPLAVAVDESLSLGEATLNNVVNGIDLLEAAQEFIEAQGGGSALENSLYQNLKEVESDWWVHIGNSNISSASPDERDAMLLEIDRMADAFDAFGDLCISDSVYQVVRGNHIRAAAIMDKLAKGDVPNDIEIADTPRTGTVVTHKVGLFFKMITGIDHELTESGAGSIPLTGVALDAAVSSADAAPTGWGSSFTPRAIAEPTLNRWIGEMIGDPANIKCQVDYTVGEIVASLTITLADLELQPLDVLHLFGTGPLDGGAELNARIAHKAKSIILVPADFEGTADDAIIEIKYTTRNEAWTTTDYSFYEKAGHIQSLRTLVTSSAPLAADGLLIPGAEEVESDAVRNQEVTELLIRITNLQARLEVLNDDWNTFFTDEISLEDVEGHTFTNVQVDGMRSLLIRSSLFGVPGTIPEKIIAFDNTVGITLINAGHGAAKAIAGRLAQAEKNMEVAKGETQTNDARVNAMMDAAKKLLGRAFVILPHFKLRNSTDLNLQLTLDQDKGLLRDASLQAMEKWSHGLGRVRERMAGLEAVQMWVENFELNFPEKQPVQFPFAPDEDGDSIDHWLGIEFPEGYQPQEDKLSLTLMNTGEIISNPDDAKAALLVDEWVEIIPNLEETSGITFHYDQPDAKPPNNLLLAVTPQEAGKWQWDNLVYTLEDTLKMAKNRAVEPEHLEDTVFGQILPGIMTEIVPPQLLPEDGEDSGDAQNNPLGLQVVTDFGVVNDTYQTETEE